MLYSLKCTEYGVKEWNFLKFKHTGQKGQHIPVHLSLVLVAQNNYSCRCSSSSPQDGMLVPLHHEICSYPFTHLCVHVEEKQCWLSVLPKNTML